VDPDILRDTMAPHGQFVPMLSLYPQSVASTVVFARSASISADDCVVAVGVVGVAGLVSWLVLARRKLINLGLTLLKLKKHKPERAAAAKAKPHGGKKERECACVSGVLCT
jgi:hypothetical protein